MAAHADEDGPTDDTDWGENTKQSHPDYPLNKSFDTIPRGWHNKHTDADEIRRFHSIEPFDISDFTKKEKPYANCLVHTTDGRYFGHTGGTNVLAVGEKGCGKSTLAKTVGVRVMDDTVRIPGWAYPNPRSVVNPDELKDDVSDDDSVTVEVDPDAVVWRGQPAASEWLPFKAWTTLHLPANADVAATWESQDRRKNQSQPADLTEHVRNVRYYDDPQDVLDSLKPGTFNVVYPDPSFSGCEQLMADSDYCPEPVPFTPAWNATDPGETTPLVHWWFAFLTARVENGPYDFLTVLFDEAADLAPEDAKADKNATYSKIKALRKVMAHSRKHYLSLMMFAHHEQNVHHKIRRTFDWRVDMPDSSANPCDINNDSPPVGFSNIPMIADMLSSKDIGYGLWWNETNFTRFRWDDIADWSEDRTRWLSLDLDKPTAGGSPRRPTSTGAP